MGKKSRRKAPRERKQQSVPVEDAYAQPLIRYRHTRHYGLEDDGSDDSHLKLLLRAIDATEEVGEEEDEEDDTWAEFTYLVVFPAYKKAGLEAALRLVKRWSRFRPYWRRLRRRICDYCGRRNDLSEPRLWVCSGCGVARYCDEECQANDISHHAKSCHILARRWDGGGCVPLCLIPLLRAGTWNDPAVLPSAQARQKLGDVGASGNPLLRALFAGDVEALEKLTD